MCVCTEYVNKQGLAHRVLYISFDMGYSCAFTNTHRVLMVPAFCKLCHQAGMLVALLLQLWKCSSRKKKILLLVTFVLQSVIHEINEVALADPSILSKTN